MTNGSLAIFLVTPIRAVRPSVALLIHRNAASLVAGELRPVAAGEGHRGRVGGRAQGGVPLEVPGVRSQKEGLGRCSDCCKYLGWRGMVSDFPEARCLVKDDCGSFPANVTYSSVVQVFYIEKALKYCVLATSPEPANKRTKGTLHTQT